MCQKTIKAILFDHDGTLVDSEEVHYKLWATILSSYNITFFKKDYICHYAGVPTTSNAEMIVNTYSLQISPKVLIQEKCNLISAYLSHNAFPLMPGVKKSLSYFKQLGVKMAVVTGAGIEGVNVTINNNDLKEFFSTIVSSDDVEYNKPAPDPYLLALKELGFTSSDCIAIEDTENGILSAISANIRCVGVSSDMSKYQDLSKASKIFKNIQEATKWIAGNYNLGAL